MNYRLTAGWIGVVGALCLARAVPAQVVEMDQCADAAHAAQSGLPPEEKLTALGVCPVTGPPLIASLWRRTASMTPRQRLRLLSTSALLRDTRVYTAVRTVATDARVGTTERLMALKALAAYFDPNLAPSDDFLRGPPLVVPHGHPIYPAMTKIAGESHPTKTDAPLGAGVRADIGRVFATLARGDRDPVVQEAARRLEQFIAHSAP